MNTYSDSKNNLVELTSSELAYFNNTVKRICDNLNINNDVVTIANDDFDIIYKGTKHINAMGTCATDDFVKYEILIDNYFIHEQYLLDTGKIFWNLTVATLEEVICHELAHCVYFRHGKKHTNKMIELLFKAS